MSEKMRDDGYVLRISLFNSSVFCIHMYELVRYVLNEFTCSVQTPLVNFIFN